MFQLITESKQRFYFNIDEITSDLFSYIFNSDSEFETDSENGDNIAPADAQAIRDAIAQDEKKKKKSRHMRVLRRFQRAGGQIGHDGVNIKSNMGARKRRRVENGIFSFVFPPGEIRTFFFQLI